MCLGWWGAAFSLPALCLGGEGGTNLMLIISDKPHCARRGDVTVGLETGLVRPLVVRSSAVHQPTRFILSADGLRQSVEPFGRPPCVNILAEEVHRVAGHAVSPLV